MTSAVDPMGGDRIGSPSEPPAPIVEEIARADARRRLRFRIIFAATWVAFIGGLIGALIWADALELSFLTEGPPWWQWILGLPREGAPFVLTGAFLTVLISVLAMVFALILAVLGSLGRLSTLAPVYAVATLYVSLIRGTPLLVQMIFFWLALPQIWLGFGAVPALVLGTAALAFNYGAYMTEIFRAGIQAVPSGQREAAAALGMSDRRIMGRIVLPQAFRIVTPAIGNEFIALMKDTSLLSVLGVTELLWNARTVGTQKFHMLETLLLAAAVYWALTIIFSFFQERLEQRMARGDR